jgi:hypothetical protein
MLCVLIEKNPEQRERSLVKEREGREKYRGLERRTPVPFSCEKDELGQRVGGGGTRNVMGREETAGQGVGSGGRKEERHMGATSPTQDCFSHLLCPLEDR